MKKVKVKKYNTKYSKILTKEFLIKEYIKGKKSSSKIAKEQGCSQMTIINYLRKFNIKTRSLKGKDQSGYIDGRTNKQHYCIDCAKKISNYRATRCRTCENKQKSKRMIGKRLGTNNPVYIHGQGNFPYPLEFNNKLKLQIRKRDNYTCQKCNITEEEHIIVYGKVLSVHHIDYIKEHCNKENLITLCNECNIRVNFNRKVWKQHFQKKILYLIRGKKS